MLDQNVSLDHEIDNWMKRERDNWERERESEKERHRVRERDSCIQSICSTIEFGDKNRKCINGEKVRNWNPKN